MSRTIDILSAIRNGEKYNASASSRAEAILKSIANGTAYTDAPKSRLEELLLAIKNKQTASGTAHSRIEEILFAIASGTIQKYLSGKNLFDVSKIKSSDVIANKGDGRLVIAGGSYYTRTQATLRELCPLLKAGDTCILKFDTDSEISSFINVGTEWYSGTSKVLTDKMLDDHLILYGFNSKDEEYGEACTISNIKIELGSTATHYTAYAFKSELEEALVATADKLKGV